MDGRRSLSADYNHLTAGLMSEEIRNIARAFLYGFTGIGLFRRLKPIGVPMEFVDTRPVQEALASGDYYVPSMRKLSLLLVADQVRVMEQKIERAIEHEAERQRKEIERRAENAVRTANPKQAH
jgi:hypothetical protein